MNDLSVEIDPFLTQVGNLTCCSPGPDLFTSGCARADAKYWRLRKLKSHCRNGTYCSRSAAKNSYFRGIILSITGAPKYS